MDQGDPKDTQDSGNVESSINFKKDNEKSNENHNQALPPKDQKVKYFYQLNDEGPFKVLCRNKNVKSKLDDSYLAFLLKRENHQPLKMNRLGNSVVIEFKNQVEANAIVRDKKINDSIDCFIPKHFVISEGRVEEVDVAHSLDDIIVHLASTNQKVIFVKRLFNRNGEESDRISVSFRSSKLPDEIHIYGRPKKVDSFNPDIRMCDNCGSFGHTTDRCNSKEKLCKNCYRKHEGSCNFKGCKNCSSGDHKWKDPICSVYKREVKIIAIQVKENVSRADAKNIIKKQSKNKSNELKHANFPALQSQRAFTSPLISYAAATAESFSDSNEACSSKMATERDRRLKEEKERFSKSESKNFSVYNSIDELIKDFTNDLIASFNLFVGQLVMNDEWKREMAQQLKAAYAQTMKNFFQEKGVQPFNDPAASVRKRLIIAKAKGADPEEPKNKQPRLGKVLEKWESVINDPIFPLKNMLPSEVNKLFNDSESLAVEDDIRKSIMKLSKGVEIEKEKQIVKPSKFDKKNQITMNNLSDALKVIRTNSEIKTIRVGEHSIKVVDDSPEYFRDGNLYFPIEMKNSTSSNEILTPITDTMMTNPDTLNTSGKSLGMEEEEDTGMIIDNISHEEVVTTLEANTQSKVGDSGAPKKSSDKKPKKKHG
jgi:hypothetical protein